LNYDSCGFVKEDFVDSTWNDTGYISLPLLTYGIWQLGLKNLCRETGRKQPH